MYTPQHGRCRHWNLVFVELAFDSTCGFPGEGPVTSKSILDFFGLRSQAESSTQSAEPVAAEQQSDTTTASAPLLPPEEMEHHELLVAYVEEVLCNPLVSGSAVVERKPDRQGRCVLLLPQSMLLLVHSRIALAGDGVFG
jgi:hypothetical protein